LLVGFWLWAEFSRSPRPVGPVGTRTGRGGRQSSLTYADKGSPSRLASISPTRPLARRGCSSFRAAGAGEPFRCRPMMGSTLRGVVIPEPMLSTRAATWPAQGDWRMEPKWDGFRLLVAIDSGGRIRAWSRRGASLGDRLGALLPPVAGAPRGSVFDGELVALSSCDGRAVQDFAAVCQAVLRGDSRRGADFTSLRSTFSSLPVRTYEPCRGSSARGSCRTCSRSATGFVWSRRSQRVVSPMSSLSRSGSRGRCSSSRGRGIAWAGRQRGASTRRLTARSRHCARCGRGVMATPTRLVISMGDVWSRLAVRGWRRRSVVVSSSPTRGSMPMARCARSGSARWTLKVARAETTQALSVRSRSDGSSSRCAVTRQSWCPLACVGTRSAATCVCGGSGVASRRS